MRLTTWLSGRKRWAPAGQYWPWRLIRRYGCQPSVWMVWNSHLAYKPRSAATMTVQSVGTLARRSPKSASQCGRHAPGRLASTICQAIGMAQPHTTTLMVRIVKRWPRVEASIANANWRHAGGDQATTQRSNAGKQLRTSKLRRLWPRLAPHL